MKKWHIYLNGFHLGTLCCIPTVKNSRHQGDKLKFLNQYTKLVDYTHTEVTSFNFNDDLTATCRVESGKEFLLKLE